jgi:hypothetical protein
VLFCPFPASCSCFPFVPVPVSCSCFLLFAGRYFMAGTESGEMLSTLIFFARRPFDSCARFTRASPCLPWGVRGVFSSGPL